MITVELSWDAHSCRSRTIIFYLVNVKMLNSS